MSFLRFPVFGCCLFSCISWKLLAESRFDMNCFKSVCCAQKQAMSMLWNIVNIMIVFFLLYYIIFFFCIWSPNNQQFLVKFVNKQIKTKDHTSKSDTQYCILHCKCTPKHATWNIMMTFSIDNSIKHKLLPIFFVCSSWFFSHSHILSRMCGMHMPFL